MDTPDFSAPVPDDPTGRLPESPPAPAEPAPEPTAPIALGPAAGGWWPPPPAPPAATPPTAPGGGGGGWGPISTPYGLAWGPTPIPAAPGTAPGHPRLVGLVAAAVAVSVLAGLGLGYAVWRPTGTPSSNVAANGGSPSGGGSGGNTAPFGGGSPSVPPSGSGNSGNAAAIASKVDPGLVDINVSLSYQNATANATGQVLTSSGEVLTNNHVVNGATSISVVDIGNGRRYSASVVGYDRTGDLAVIQLHGASGLKTVSIGDSSKVKVGDSVVAIGNAGGYGGTPSVAPGSVTTLNQAITASDDNGANAEQLTGLIEVNANVQPGDSGGPLVNSAGDVVGIDTAASASFSISSANGDGYAIPINEAISIAHQIEGGQSSTTVHVGPTAFLGVVVESPLDAGGSGPGAAVADVAPNSPADTAGLTVGDVITSVAGQTVDSPSGLSSIIAGHVPGDSVQVQWVDVAGTSHSATVALASGPAT